MDAREYVVLSNSASKRALFPSLSLPKCGRSDDEDSLGHMSPLRSSSPDRYSSPPPSPCWVQETPSKAPETCENDIRNLETVVKACQNLHSCVAESTPQKMFTDIVQDTPEKEYERDMTTPFKCLIQRKKIEETPDSAVSKMLDVTKKLSWKKSLRTDSPQKKNDDEKNNFDFNSSIAKLIKNSFYRPTHSRAKTSLFPDRLSVLKQPAVSVVSKVNPVRHLNATYPGGHVRKGHKRPRAMLGEINAGVRHKVKKPKLRLKRSYNVSSTKSMEKPLISPDDRVQKYIVDNRLLDKGSTPPKRPRLNIDVSSPSNNADKHNERIMGRSPLQEITSSSIMTPIALQKENDRKSPEVQTVIDPNKKFFKTNRTMAIDHKATVTVANVKIQVHNGKLALNNHLKKIKTVKKKDPVAVENIFEEDPVSTFEKNTVQETVQEVLQKLDNELETSLPSDDFNHIQSITTSTSSLALHDCEVVNTNEPSIGEENLNPEDSATGTPDGSGKLYPVFYKRKGLYEASTLKKISPPGKKIRPLGENQYQIDAGQSRYKAVHCKECGTLYHLGDPEDEIAHYNIHHNISTFRFLGWKNEHLIKLLSNGGRVIVIYPDDHKIWVNKAKDVLGTVDREMGFVDGAAAEIDSNKVYLYILKNRIVGVLAAEPIKNAYKMINTGVDGPDCCSEETYPVKCGVSRVWTAPDQRRKRIATNLLDCLRLSFMFDHILNKLEIAFSVPTEQGKAFAASYMKTAEFMVYYK